MAKKMVSAMEKEKLNAYAARVSQANRSELVVIMYEAFLDSVKEGDAQMKQGDMPACPPVRSSAPEDF